MSRWDKKQSVSVQYPAGGRRDRRLKNAKRKNVIHLKETGDRLERIAEKLETGVQVFDSELYSALKLYDKNRT